MNKTNRTIGVILLVLGVLSVIGGIGVSIYSRAAAGNRISEFREEILPTLREGERSDFSNRFPALRISRALRANKHGNIPTLLLISGGMLLAGGIVLMIVGNNHQQLVAGKDFPKKPETKQQIK